MKINQVLDLARVFFLATSIACAGVAYVWHKHPKLVERADGWLVHQARADTKREWARAKDLAEAGRAEDSIRTLESLVPTLRGIRRGDRQEDYRRASLGLLADLLGASGQFEQALGFADELREFDDRDLLNEVRRGRLQRELGLQEESIATLAEAARIGWQNSEILGAYLEGLALAGEADRALHLVLELGDRGLVGVGRDHWQSIIHAVDGEKMRAREILGVDGFGQMRWTIPVAPEPCAIKIVRIDLPVSPELILEDVSIELRGEDGSSVLLGLEHLMRARDLGQTEKSLEYTEGNDPYFILEVPEEAQALAITEVEFRAHVRRPLAEGLRAALVEASARADRSALVEAYGEATVTQLEGAIR